MGKLMVDWRAVLARCAVWTAPLLARVSSQCPLCRAPAASGRFCGLCGVCRAALRQGSGQLPPASLEGVDALCHAFAYEAPGDVLIWQYKVGLRLRHARLLAGLMADAWRAQQPWAAGLPCQAGAPVLVPVPSSRRSLLRRGFNPARELSRHLAGQLMLRERPDWLLRHETAHKQAALGRRARSAIRDGVFHCPAAIPSAVVILVDDVVTTGSTASAAALSLKAAGAAWVGVLAAARVPPPGRPSMLAHAERE